MKVLITCESYPPDVCGVANVVSRLAEGLVVRGHDVAVATGASPERTQGVQNGVRVFRFSVTGSPIVPYRGQVDAYVRFIREYTPEVLVNECAQTWSTDLLLPILQEIPGKKILHLHGLSGLSSKPRHPYRRWLLHRYFQQAARHFAKYHRLIFLSKYSEELEFSRQHGLSNYVFLGNGADEEFFSDPSESACAEGDAFLATMGIGKDTPLVLNVSNFGQAKNQEFVLNAMHRIPTEFAGLLVGSTRTDYLNRLEHLQRILAFCLGKKAVFMKIGVPRALLPFLYRRASVFAHGSRQEAFPLVLAESVASGTPFVSTPVGNAAGLPGGVVVRTPAAMAVSIDRLLTSPVERARLAKAALDFAQTELRWPRIVEGFERILAG